MQYTQAKMGRVFVLRLEHGDRLPQAIEQFAAEQDIKHAFCALLGGIGSGTLVMGPKDGQANPIEPIMHPFAAVHEAAALGTLFPTEDGQPRLHMHAALGRDGRSLTGCIRPGIEVWRIGEVIIYELINLEAQRRLNPDIGAELLELD